MYPCSRWILPKNSIATLVFEILLGFRETVTEKWKPDEKPWFWVKFGRFWWFFEFCRYFNGFWLHVCTFFSIGLFPRSADFAKLARRLSESAISPRVTASVCAPRHTRTGETRVVRRRSPPHHSNVVVWRVGAIFACVVWSMFGMWRWRVAGGAVCCVCGSCAMCCCRAVGFVTSK